MLISLYSVLVTLLFLLFVFGVHAVIFLKYISVMTTKTPTPKFSKDKSYDLYKQEVSYWCFATETPKHKQAITLILNIPDDCPIKAQVMENCVQADLEKDEGVKTYLSFLEKVYGKDDLCDTLDKYRDFRGFKKTDGMSMQEYITGFIQIHSKILKKGVKFPNEVLAYELIHNSGISKDEEKLVQGAT